MTLSIIVAAAFITGVLSMLAVVLWHRSKTTPPLPAPSAAAERAERAPPSRNVLTGDDREAADVAMRAAGLRPPKRGSS